MPKLLILIVLLFCLPLSKINDVPDSKRASDVRLKVWPRLQKELTDKNFDSNYRLYIRIIKNIDLLEIWAKKGNTYELFKRYDICYYLGDLGTKTRSGDNKSPEGFYTIEAGQLFPDSRYHLAMNIGYPNKLERLKGYTGDAIMIHGRCASVGCYAMTDEGIDEIYTLVYKALKSGQKKVDLAIYPFRMTDEKTKSYVASPYYSFWKTLKPGYQLFENSHVPPTVGVKNLQYVFGK